ncbi:MAG TPA: DedA family protein [Symbiobacteriaceae bacterium]|jgi:membrane protein DedA with SNARE-associated domain
MIVRNLLRSYGYAALVLILGLDSSGVPWPTEATLVVTGGLAAHGQLNVFVALLASLAGAMMGSSLSYYLGRKMGPSLMQRIGSWFRLTPAQIGKVDEWFARHGHRAAFWGRLVPFVRNFTGYPAGILGVPFGKYLLMSAAGYAVYDSIALGIGYGGLSFLRWWMSRLEMAGWIVIPLALIVGWFMWGRKWLENRQGKG